VKQAKFTRQPLQARLARIRPRSPSARRRNFLRWLADRETRSRRVIDKPRLRGLGDLLPDEVDGVADRHELRRDVIRDIDVEPLFAGHDDFNDVEAVGAEVVDEPGIVRDLRPVGSEMESEDLSDPCSNVCYQNTLPLHGHTTMPTGWHMKSG
jgi:hypothetical protein